MLRTKIVCTLGPATSSPEAIESLVRGGMDMARINMSHGDPEQHKEVIHLVRRFAKGSHKPVAILVDLQGPKIRVGRLAEPAILISGEEIVFAPEGREREDELPTTYEHLAADVEPGDRVLLDDGLMELECTAASGDRAIFRVIRGGVLKSNKGINIPEGLVTAPSLTEKDLRDLDFALENRAEFIGLSFVRSKADVSDLKERVAGRALIVAKIEMARALVNIEEIINEADAVMVARGDLGVELPFERVPLAQKRIIQLANFHGRPVITATQMLESMIEYPRPTRAETSDVANAVLDGTDALMLSGETAIGKYPFEAMNALVRIGHEIESSGVLERGPRYLLKPNPRFRAGASPREHAVAAATVDAARSMMSPAILVITRSGFSARLVSSYRPAIPIFAITTDPMTFRQLTAVWGVYPVLAEEKEVTYESLTDFGKQSILDSGAGKPGQSIPVTAGIPFHQAGSTNTMRVEQL